MAKQRRSTVNAPASVPATPWYKKLWVIVVTVTGVVTAILMQGPTMLENLQKLPSGVSTTWSKFQSWRGDDEAWTAVWSATAEGYVDHVDMKLTDVDLRLELIVNEGRLDGMVSAKSICNAIPLFNFILLEGTTNGRTATVKVFDIIQGSRKEFGELQLRRDGAVLTVTPKSDPFNFFPKVARIARHTVPNTEEEEVRDTFCEAERKVFLEKARPSPQK